MTLKNDKFEGTTELKARKAVFLHVACGLIRFCLENDQKLFVTKETIASDI